MAKRNHAPGPLDEIIVTSVRLTRGQHDALKQIAAREHRSLAGELRSLIEQRLADIAEREAA